MSGIIDAIRHEPVIIVGLVDAVLVLLVTFGLQISDDQKKAIDGVLAAVIVVLSVITRSQVTPTIKTEPVITPPVTSTTP